MDQDISATPLRVVHVIGLVGSGKSTFIRQYLYEWPAFDIQGVYKECNFAPDDLFENPEAYHQFRDALKYYLEGFIAEARANACPLVVVESSGVNQVLNGFL